MRHLQRRLRAFQPFKSSARHGVGPWVCGTGLYAQPITRSRSDAGCSWL